MNCGNKIIRDGINQIDRILEALQTDYVHIDERSQEDLLLFMYNLAEAFVYYDSDNQPDGTIQSFFDGPEDIRKLLDLQNLPEPQDLQPNKALLLVFTKLFAYAQHELNTLTKRHLEFYYKQVLGITRKKANPDQVQLLFELVKSAEVDQYKIPIGTSLDGGRDKNGNSLIYKTDQEIIVNRGAIKKVSTLFIDIDAGKSRIFAAPVADSSDGLGSPLEEDNNFWPAFGEPQLARGVENRNMIDAAIGFAVSSPILVLQEGIRQIELNFSFDPLDPLLGYEPDSLLHQCFTILCSGDKGWFEPGYYTSQLIRDPADPAIWSLKIVLVINPEQPPLSFFNAILHQETFNTSWPVLKILLKPDTLSYDTLKPFRVKSVGIKVDVKDVKNLVIQNDQGVADPSKPFLPFGNLPTIGSNFIIGNIEVFQKKLNYLSFHIEWHEVPDSDLGNYYQVYDPGDDVNNNSFEADLELLYKRNWNNILKPAISLFNSTDASLPRQIEISMADFDVHTSEIDYTREPTDAPNSPYSLINERGFVRFKLTRPIYPFKAFGHKEFPKLYAQQAIALAKYDAATSVGPEPVLPNPPYTPSIKSISLDYRSEEIIQPDQSEYDSVYRIGPFGHSQLVRGQGQIVPQFNNQGELYIGIENLSVPATINFLFHLEEGTADEEFLLSEENISWSYLSYNQWILLGSNEILVDTTQSFLTSGIISIVIPRDATDNNVIFPSGLYWLKVAVLSGAVRASKVRQILTNAVTATLETDPEDPLKFDTHLRNPLDPFIVKNLINKVSQVKRINQPFPSYNGRPTELPETYYTRVSERLRHKHRGVQNWDYERLVLDEFPGIFKAKCLAHTGPDSEINPGSITIIVVSNLRDRNSANPFKPRTGQVVLNKIDAYLRKYVSLFIDLYIENPVYETLLVDVKIGFREGYDPGYYAGLLNQELKQFLSPWAFEEGKDIVIGSRIYKSAILLFIESREYVDYVVDLKLYHLYEGPRPGGIGEMEIGYDFIVAPVIKPAIGEMIIGKDFIVGEDVEVACATTPRSILVTHQNHRISALRPDELSCPGSTNLGIGFMTVGIDFIISNSA